MPVTVRIPSPLRGLTGDRSRVAAAGATVGEVLEALGRAHPGLRERLLDERGAPRRHLGLFLNDQQLSGAGALGAPVRDGDELSLVPAIAGGAPELDEARIARWARQLLVPGFGAKAQERLMASRVRVVGAGPVAAPALVYLAQAGVGTIWIDDPGPREAEAPAGWLLGTGVAGPSQADAVVEALAPFSSFTAVGSYPLGGVPTATLISAASAAQALAAAEAARRARVPHVVAEVDGEGGSLVSVPVGAPCFACGRGTTGAGRAPEPGAAALAALAAGELLLLVADPSITAGRRHELLRGVSSVRATARLTGCACNPMPTPAAPAADGQQP